MAGVKWLAALSCVAALGGCAFFPQNIHQPQSIFEDPALGTRGSPLRDDTSDAARQVLEYARKAADAQRAALSARPADKKEANDKAIAAAREAVTKADNLVLQARDPSSASRASPPAPAPAEIGALDADLERKLVAAWVAMDHPGGSATYTDALQLGIQVMDRRCGRYFSALGTAAQRMSFAGKELGLTTGVVAALQGLTGVAADDIAITAALLGFLGASSNAYGEVFVFSPDVGSVESLVLNGQQAIKDRIRTMAPADFSKPVVIGLLQSYEKTCEVKTIRRLVNESLSTSRPVATFASDLPSTARAAVAAALGVPALTDDQLAAVYWLAYKAPPTSAEKEILQQVLAGIPSLVAQDGKLLDVGRLQPTLRLALAPLLAAGTAQLDAKVEQLRKDDKTAGFDRAGDRAAAGTGLLFAPAITLTIIGGQR